MENMAIICFHYLGRPIDETKGLYHTNQYSLYKIFINRALTDPRRASTPKDAHAFIIPYDLVTFYLIIRYYAGIRNNVRVMTQRFALIEAYGHIIVLMLAT